MLNLRRISANLKKVNLGDNITDLDERGLNLKTGNVGELKESEIFSFSSPQFIDFSVHMRLQEELISTEDMELSLNAELDEIEMEERRVQEELANINGVVDSNDYIKVI